MKELLTRIRNSIFGYLERGKDRDAFIEEFDILLEKRDTSDVWRQFAIWLLVDPVYGVLKFTKPGTDEHHVIQRVAQLYKDDCKDIAQWNSAASAASNLILGPVVIGDFSNAPFYAVRAAYAAASAVWCAVAADYAAAVAADYADYDVAADAADVAHAAADYAVSSVSYAESAYKAVYSDDMADWADWAAAVATDNTYQAMADRLIHIMLVAPRLPPL